MPNKVQEFDGDVIIHGNLEVIGGINEADMSEIQTAAQVTNSVSEVLTANIADMASDNKLTAVEKLAVKRMWDNIAAEYTEVIARAAVWGLVSGMTQYDAFAAAYAALDDYLNGASGVIDDLTTTTAITGSTLRTNFSDYYDTKASLLEQTDDMTVMIGPGDTGLVGYWPQNGSQDDFSGKGHHGTLTAGAGEYEDGYVGGAFHLDGAASFIAIADHSDLDFGTGDMSVSGWFYSDDNPSTYEFILNKRAATQGWVLYTDPTDSDKLRFRIEDNGEGKEAVSNAAIVSGSWQHFVCVLKSNVAYLYLNTILQTTTGTLAGDNDTDNAVPLYLGIQSGVNFPFDGLIDEVRLYNKALSQAEVTFLYRNPSGVQMTAPIPKDPGKANLRAYYPLDEIEGTRVTDKSGRGYHGKLGVSGGDWEDGFVYNAYHLDGVLEHIALPTSLGSTLSAASLCAWVNVDTLAPSDDENSIIELRQSAEDDRIVLRFMSGTNDRIQFLLVVDPTSSLAESDAAIAARTWYHVVGTYDGTTIRLYVNGILQSTTGSMSSASYVPDENAIGSAGNTTTNNNWDGKIDEVRIYDKALSPEEVLYLYRNPGGTPKGLITRDDVAVGELNAKHLWFGGYHSLITNDQIFQESDGELFPLDFTCLSDLGLVPESKLVHYEPAVLRDSNGNAYNNPRAKMWDGLEDDPYTDTIGVWQATENIIPFPEDVTEWDEVSCSTEVLDEFFEGVPWQRVTCDDTDQTYAHDTFEFGTDPISVRCVVRKGPSQTGNSVILLYDLSIAAGGAGLAQALINWGAGTVTVGMSGAGISAIEVDENWILANTIVSVSFIAMGLSTGEADTSIRFYPDTTEATGRYADFCKIQVEDKSYPTPYIPTSRPTGMLQYRKYLPDEGAIECYVRGRSTYNDNADHVIWCWYKDATHYFRLLYDGTGETFRVEYKWGTNERILVGSAVVSNAAYWAWKHVKVIWDFSAGAGKLRVNSAQEDAAWNDTPDTYAADGYDFYLGEFGDGTLIFDGEITDLATLIAEDETDTHVDADAPWRGEYSVPNYDQTIILSRKMGKFIRADLAMVDKKHRTIDVGSQGLLARDRAGNITHDLPNGAILTDMIYSGHAIFMVSPSEVDTLTTSFTDAETAVAATDSVVQNLDLSAELPGDTDNIKGVIIRVKSTVQLQAAKVGDDTIARVFFLYCNVYNTTPLSYNRCAGVDGVGVFNAGEVAGLTNYSMVLAPVVFNGGTPYLSWLHHYQFANMVAGNANYYAFSAISILGYLV